MKGNGRGKIALCLVWGFLVFVGGMAGVHAFSLLGPYESWMTQTNGFEQLGDIGGPMNIGNGYRWNVPVVTYAYDSSFVDFFGSNGVAAVDGAIQILNNLPPASQMDPTSFPLDSHDENSEAWVEELMDLKSETLFLLLQQMGLTQPQRFMFCVHDYSATNGVGNATVVMRNFDPISFVPADVLNGTLYTNFLYWQISNGTQVDWVMISAGPVIPQTIPPPPPPVPWTTAVAEDWGGIYTSGFLYTNLTSDDAGGLRYLLQTNNYNYETLLPDVRGTGTNTGNYVNLALRAGVDKITFVRETLDPVTGEFFPPVTNQYTDTYITNGILMQQQLARVTTAPDIIFSAYSATAGSPPVECTGTTNWLNNASLYGNPGGAGPGIIRPQVTISFRKYGPTSFATTWDTGNPASLLNTRWASYDNSTNPPVIYPTQPGAGAGNPWTIQLALVNQNNQLLPGGLFVWQVPVSIGSGVALESSPDLINWTTLTTVTNYGMPLSWGHVYTRPTGYFRVVPQ